MKKGSACTIENRTPKNVARISDHIKSNIASAIMFLDLSYAKPPKKGLNIPKPQWRMITDEATNLKISHWYANNN
jgi:hypothetical protein